MTIRILLTQPLRFIILSALVGAVVASALAAVWPTRYRVSLALTIDQRPRAAAAEYDYDGYYALRATELFADTVIGWLAMPTVISDVYAKAGLAPSEEESMRLTRQFNAKRYSSQSVLVRFDGKDRALAATVAKAVGDVIAARAAELQRNAKGEPLFEVRPSHPIIAESSPSVPRAALIGFMIAAIAAALAAWFMKPPSVETTSGEPRQ
jgi:hypothetical protein